MKHIRTCVKLATLGAAVACMATTAFAGDKNKTNYIAVDPSFIGGDQSSPLAIDSTVYDKLVPKETDDLKYANVEHLVSVLSMDAAASFGLGTFSLSGSGEFVTVVADSIRSRPVPVTFTKGTEKAQGWALVGVACRLRFAVKATDLEATIKSLNAGASFSYRAETLAFGAYGFPTYQPFKLMADKGTVDIAKTRCNMIDLFNAYNEEPGREEFRPLLLGFKVSSKLPPLDKEKWTVTVGAQTYDQVEAAARPKKKSG